MELNNPPIPRRSSGHDSYAAQLEASDRVAKLPNWGISSPDPPEGEDKL